MDRDTWLKFYEKADPAIQDYLLSTLSAEQEDKAQTALGFDNDAWDRIMDAVWELVFLKEDRQTFSEKITKASVERNSDEVEKVVLQDVVYPMADMVLWDVEARLQELGADMEQVQATPRISLRPVSYGAAARRIATNTRISVFNEETIRKLREILVSYLKGVRTKEQVLEVLQRGQAEGGMGLELTKAESFLDEMIKFISTTEILSEEKYATWYQKYQADAAEEAHKTVLAAKAAEAPAPGVETEEETTPVMRAIPKTNNKPLDDALANALAEIGEAVSGEYLQRRLQNLISTRLRGVRNKLQVIDVLTRSEKVGGLNLSSQEADRIAEIIEKYFHAVYEQVSEIEKQKIAQVEEKQKTKIKERRQEEAKEHEEWYKERLEQGAVGTAQALFRRTQGDEPAPAPQTEGLPLTTKPHHVNKMPMRDIEPPVKLTGLAEELGTMTLEQFRRLSNDPTQAAQQILQKMSTLKRDSFESWTKGVEAWRESPLQRIYLQLVAESFTRGLPVTELVQEKKESGQALPTAEELGAIIDLNSKIQLS